MYQYFSLPSYTIHKYYPIFSSIKSIGSGFIVSMADFTHSSYNIRSYFFTGSLFLGKSSPNTPFPFQFVLFLGGTVFWFVMPVFIDEDVIDLCAYGYILSRILKSIELGSCVGSTSIVAQYTPCLTIMHALFFVLYRCDWSILCLKEHSWFFLICENL